MFMKAVGMRPFKFGKLIFQIITQMFNRDIRSRLLDDKCMPHLSPSVVRYTYYSYIGNTGKGSQHPLHFGRVYILST